MPYNEHTAERISDFFKSKKVKFYGKKMFSGICFMVNDKMCCGTHIDKETEEDVLLCRIAVDAYEDALEKEHVIPMDFTGKSMKGFIYVKEKGIKNQKDLYYWLQMCLDFNPLAKASKKNRSSPKRK